MSYTTEIESKYDEMVNKAINLFLTATTNELYQGFTWYTQAYCVVKSIAEAHNRTEREVACVMSCLSVKTDWDKNVQGTWNFYANADGEVKMLVERGDKYPSKYTTYGTSLAKAYKIYTDTEYTLVPDFLSLVVDPESAPKTRRFATAILGIDTAIDCVVIDRHIINLLGLDEHKSLTIKQYKILEKVIFDAYKYCLLSSNARFIPNVHAFQAVLWITHRNNKHPNKKQQDKVTSK